jgi:hypothetical protein
MKKKLLNYDALLVILKIQSFSCRFLILHEICFNIGRRHTEMLQKALRCHITWLKCMLSNILGEKVHKYWMYVDLHTI